MKRLFIFSVFLLLSLQHGFAQNKLQVKYYDSLWKETSRDSAVYYARYGLTDSGYKSVGYWMKSGKMKYNYLYADSTYTLYIGWNKQYYENGQLEDSTFYSPKTEMLVAYHYYENGKLWASYKYDSVTQQKETIGYDEKGQVIKGFFYAQEADYPGGNQAWREYLARKLKPNTPVKYGAPDGQYMVIIRFMISPDGRVTNMEPETHFRFGMEEEAMRVIGKSSKWRPAYFLNKPVNAYRRQPVTFVVNTTKR